MPLPVAAGEAWRPLATTAGLGVSMEVRWVRCLVPLQVAVGETWRSMATTAGCKRGAVLCRCGLQLVRRGVRWHLPPDLGYSPVSHCGNIGSMEVHRVSCLAAGCSW